MSKDKSLYSCASVSPLLSCSNNNCIPGKCCERYQGKGCGSIMLNRLFSPLPPTRVIKPPQKGDGSWAWGLLNIPQVVIRWVVINLSACMALSLLFSHHQRMHCNVSPLPAVLDSLLHYTMWPSPVHRLTRSWPEWTSWDLLVSSLPQPEKLALDIIYFDTLTYDDQFNCAEELLQLEKDQIHGLCLVAGTSPISQLRQQHSRLAFSVNTPSLLLVRFWFNSERSHYLKKYLCKFSADSRGTQSYLSHLLVYKMLLL